MFLVEIRIPHEDRLSKEMSMMRTWLDNQKYEPIAFRYSLSEGGILFKVEFSLQDDALAFASAFGGELIGNAAIY